MTKRSKNKLLLRIALYLKWEGLFTFDQNPAFGPVCIALSKYLGKPFPEKKAKRWKWLSAFARKTWLELYPRLIPKDQSKPKYIPAKQRKKVAETFYETREWRELRYRALKLHGNKCQCCGRSPPSVILHVDHIKPRSKFPELELDITNLQILCEDDNLGKSAWDHTDWRPKIAAVS